MLEARTSPTVKATGWIFIAKERRNSSKRGWPTTVFVVRRNSRNKPKERRKPVLPGTIRDLDGPRLRTKPKRGCSEARLRLLDERYVRDRFDSRTPSMETWSSPATSLAIPF